MPSALELEWMLIPFLACLVISVIHVYLGLHVISRKVIFVDLALAQIAAVGATYAATLGYDPNSESVKVQLFSLAFTFVGAVAFSIARMRKEKVPQEAFIGIIYAAASALAILILSKSATGGEELKHMLVGDVLLVSWRTVIQVAVLYALIGAFHILFRRKFLAISLNPEEAEAAGIRVRLWDILFYMFFGIVITKSVAIAGVLLVFSYLVVPAVVAQMWADSIRGRLMLGWIVAILASVAGIWWSFRFDYPTGPAVVVMLSLSLIVSGAAYYCINSPVKVRAAANVIGILLFGILFFTGVSYFRKATPDAETKLAPVDLLLNELKEGEEAHQLDAVQHLGDMHDPRIVPALTKLLDETQSDQLIEAIVQALGKQRNPQAIPALQAAVKRPYDDFLKLTIARAQLGLGDRDGFQTLIGILKDEEAGFARAQAVELLETYAARKFKYNAEKEVTENAAALKEIDVWWNRTGRNLKWNSKSEQFR